MPDEFLNPVTQLPTETLLTIFTLCVGSSVRVNATDRCAVPLDPLSEVCSRWRWVIHGTPELWVNLSLHFKDWGDLDSVYVVKIGIRCLSHTGDLSGLSLSLNHAPLKRNIMPQPDHEAYPIRDLIIPYANRLKDIKLALPLNWLSEFLLLPEDRFSILQSLHVEVTSHVGIRNPSNYPGQRGLLTVSSTLSNLRNLALRSYPFTITGLLLSWTPTSEREVLWAQLTSLDLLGTVVPHDSICNILKKCSNLESLSITPGFVNMNNAGDIPLPFLTTLTVDLKKGEGSSPWIYLRNCKLPVLEHLFVQGDSEDRFWPDDMATLIKHSPVTTMHISLPVFGNYIERIFDVTPFLKDFTATQDCCISDLTFQRMESGDLVSRLQRLVCPLQAIWLTSFIEMLGVRWALASDDASLVTLQTAEISCLGYTEEMAADARAQLLSLGERAKRIELLF